MKNSRREPGAAHATAPPVSLPDREPAVLRLQRLAGNRAVVELLGGSKIDPPHQRLPVQRRFGFEIETDISLLSSRMVGNQHRFLDGGVSADPYPVVARGVGFKVHVDHHPGMALEQGDEFAPKGPVVELVTDPPIDEFQASESDVANTMLQMANFASSALLLTKGGRTPLSSIIQAPRDLVVGSNYKTQKLNAGIQATYGIALDRISDIMKIQGRTASPVPSAANPGPVAQNPLGGGPPPPPPPPGAAPAVAQAHIFQAMSDAQACATQITDDLWNTYDAEMAKANRPHTAARSDLAKLEGLVALVSNYLQAGKYRLGKKWTKNFVGQLLYKSRLSSVAREIGGLGGVFLKSSPLLGGSKLRKGGRSHVIDVVLQKNGRSADEIVLKKPVEELQGLRGAAVSTILCGSWLKHVFSGSKDDMFDRLRNQYDDASTELKPEQIGPSNRRRMAAIMENRQLGSLIPRKASVGGKGENPAEWADLGVRLYKLLREVNGAQGPVDRQRTQDILDGKV